MKDNEVMNIENTEILEIINTKLERNDFFPEIAEDLIDISTSKTISYDNIQELMTYLKFAFESNDHYYEGAKHLIMEENTLPVSAFSKMDREKEENDTLYGAILKVLAPESFSE